MNKYKIIIKQRDQVHWEQELSDGIYTVGRSKSSDIKIDLPDISRKHLEINAGNGQVHLTNFSSHGTYFQNVPIRTGFLLENGMAVALSKTTFLIYTECNTTEEDADATVLASSNPILKSMPASVQKSSIDLRNINEKEEQTEGKIFFEAENQPDCTLETNIMKTRIARPDEIKALRIRDSRKKNLKIAVLGIVVVVAFLGLGLLYTINFAPEEETLSWPVDPKGNFYGQFFDSQIGSYATGQFSVSVPFIQGISQHSAKDGKILISTKFGKRANVSLQIAVLHKRKTEYLRKTLTQIFKENLSELQKRLPQMSYSGISDVFYLSNDNGIPAYNVDFTRKDSKGNSWCGYIICFKNGSDFFMRLVEVPAHERMRAWNSIGSIPFLKFSPSYTETIWDSAGCIIPGKTEDFLLEVNRHLAKQAPFEWQRSHVLLMTLLARSQENNDVALEKQAIELLRVMRHQQKRWFNSQKKIYYQAELEKKDTRSIIELCKSVFSSPNDLRYQMLRRNRWE